MPFTRTPDDETRCHHQVSSLDILAGMIKHSLFRQKHGSELKKYSGLGNQDGLLENIDLCT